MAFKMKGYAYPGKSPVKKIDWSAIGQATGKAAIEGGIQGLGQEMGVDLSGVGQAVSGTIGGKKKKKKKKKRKVDEVTSKYSTTDAPGMIENVDESKQSPANKKRVKSTSISDAVAGMNLGKQSPAKNYKNPQDYKVFNMGNKPTPVKKYKKHKK